jgi:peptide/nickel transport system permease protein
MPIIVLVIIQIALIIRVTRSSMLEALNKPYIILAKAKGLSDKEVINKHARRNALIPTVTLSGLLVAGMLTGLVITETVFNMPGLGSWAARSAQTLDIAAVLGFTMFSAVVFVLSNLIVDILYAYLDPRIRLA